MFSVKIERVPDVITVDDDFATLVNFTPSDVTFQIHYTVARLKAMQQGAVKVRIVVMYDDVQLSPLVKSEPISAASILKGSSVNEELMRGLNVRDTAAKRTALMAAVSMGDVTAHVSNEDLKKMTSTSTRVYDVKSFAKSGVTTTTSAVLKSQGTSVVSMAATSAKTTQTSGVNPRTAAIDLISSGKDPSTVVGMNHRSVTAHDAAVGFSQITRATEFDNSPGSNLRDYIVAPRQPVPRTSQSVPDNEYVQFITQTSDENVTMIQNVVVPRTRTGAAGTTARGAQTFARQSSSSGSKYIVKFELIGRDGVIVDTVTRTIEIDEHIRAASVPQRPPSVSTVAGAISSQASIDIVQNDSSATRVRVYKKYVDSPDGNTDTYQYVGEYALRIGARRRISVVVPMSAYAIYRFIATTADGLMGTDFTNVVIRPKKAVHPQYVALVTKIVNDGVQVSASSFPTNAVAVRIMRRDASSHEQWSNIGTTQTVRYAGGRRMQSVIESRKSDCHYGPHGTTHVIGSSDEVLTTDTEVEPDRVYEYTCDVVMRDGSIVRMGYTALTYIPLSRGYVKLALENVNVTEMTSAGAAAGKSSVTFNIRGAADKKTQDNLKDMLVAQGLYEHYTDDMTNERDKLSNVMAYNVKRVDLGSGQIVDYGIITSETFVEADLVSTKGSTPAESGRKYRYDVTPLLRDPETMMTTITRTETDPTTKRTYTYSPSKFRNPLSLRTGTIVTPTSVVTRHGVDQMSLGSLGQTVSVDVDLTTKSIFISGLSASRFNRTKNVVTWTVPDDVGRVDHFLVIKEVQGVRTIIGKVHTQRTESSYIFYHDLTSHDAGVMRYVVIPVLGSYAHGTEATSQNVVIDSDDVAIEWERNRTLGNVRTAEINRTRVLK